MQFNMLSAASAAIRLRLKKPRCSVWASSPALVLAGFAASVNAVHAQTITTAPVAAPVETIAAVPTAGWWMLVLMALALAFVGARLIRSGQVSQVAKAVLGAVVAVGIVTFAGYNPVVSAQQLLSAFSFTQASGETLPIPILRTPTSGLPTDFTPVQFTNASQRKLKIASIAPPASAATCFPFGIPASLPATPVPLGQTPCAENLELANGSSCTVNVASLCAQLASLISVSPTTASFNVNGTTTLTVSASASSPQPALAPAVQIPAGSNLSVQSTTCAASLAPGASCSVTLTASTAEGPTTVTVAGTNSNAVSVALTVQPSPPTLTSSSRAMCNSTNAGTRFIRLTGTQLASASSVMLGSVASPSITVASETEILAVLPAGWSGGVQSITVTTPGGTSAPMVKTFDAPTTNPFCAGGTAPGSFGMFNIFGTSQTYSVNGICVLCGVVNPNNPISNTNTTDYSQFAITVDLLGVSVQQDLIGPVPVPASPIVRRVGVIVSDDTPDGLTAQDAARIGLSLYDGSTLVVSPSASQLTLLSMPELPTGQTQKMLVFDVPANEAFDRIRVTLTSTNTGGIQGLRVYGAVIEQGVN